MLALAVGTLHSAMRIAQHGGFLKIRASTSGGTVDMDVEYQSECRLPNSG
jgi:hypothetical protein